MIMKYILFFLVIFNVQGEQMRRHWNTLMDHALSAKYPGYTPNQDDDCAKNCQKTPDFYADILAVLYASGGHVGNTTREIFRTSMLTKVCKFANDIAACVRACPNTQRREFLRELTAPLKYLCVDSNLITKSDCISDAYGPVENLCSEQCAVYKSNVTDSYLQAQNHPRISELGVKQSFETVLDKACLYIRCKVSCSDQSRLSKCGKSTNKEFHKLLQKISKSLDTARYLVWFDYLMENDSDRPANNEIIDVPESCKYKSQVE